ncbi:MAG: hypothetical protein ABJQ29_13450 [Luteolibacter sp.]
MDYRIENDIIIFTVHGNTPVSVIIATFEAALADPAAVLPALILVDGSRSTAIRTTHEVETFAAALSGWKDKIKKIAIYVTSELHYGTMRMGTAYSSLSSFDVMPFRSYEEAMDFLEKSRH